MPPAMLKEDFISLPIIKGINELRLTILSLAIFGQGRKWGREITWPQKFQLALRLHVKPLAEKRNSHEYLDAILYF